MNALSLTGTRTWVSRAKSAVHSDDRCHRGRQHHASQGANIRKRALQRKQEFKVSPIYYEMVHGRLYRADESNTAGNDGTDQAAISEGVVADASHRPWMIHFETYWECFRVLSNFRFTAYAYDWI